MKLDKRVAKDPVTGEVVSDHRRGNHSQNARGCTWAMYWSVRSVGKRNLGVVAGQLGITRDTHSHLRVFLARRTRVARILVSTPRMV
jgi:hypothetical protein